MSPLNLAKTVTDQPVAESVTKPLTMEPENEETQGFEAAESQDQEDSQQEVVGDPDEQQAPEGQSQGEMLQADYTRKTQELAEERRVFESQRAEFQQFADFGRRIHDAMETDSDALIEYLQTISGKSQDAPAPFIRPDELYGNEEILYDQLAAQDARIKQLEQRLGNVAKVTESVIKEREQDTAVQIIKSRYGVEVTRAQLEAMMSETKNPDPEAAYAITALRKQGMRQSAPPAKVDKPKTPQTDARTADAGDMNADAIFENLQRGRPVG